MKGSAGRSAAPVIKIQQKYTRNDIYEKYVKDRLEIRVDSILM